MQYLPRSLRKSLVIENGVLAICILVVVLGAIGWAGIRLLREDTAPLMNEIVQLKAANARIQSKNEELVLDQRQQQNQGQEIARLNRERDAAKAGRDEAVTSLQGQLNDARRDNRDLKADLVSAASERDRMRQQLIEVRAKAAELEDGRATRAAVR